LLSHIEESDMEGLTFGAVPQLDLAKLPGAEIVLPGIEDLKAGRETVNSLAVRAAAARLGVGDLVGDSDTEEPAAHRLYLRLDGELGDSAHSRYNAILARVASFARAADHAQAG
jgi:hypothetical protein